MKKLLILSLLTLSCLLLFACKEAPENNPGNPDDPVDLVQSGSIDNIVFLPDRISFTETRIIYQLWVNDERVFYYTFKVNNQDNVHLVVTSMRLDGTDIQNAEIPVTMNRLIGIDITDGEFIEVLLSDPENTIYAKYDLQGQELDRHHFEDFTMDNIGWQVADVLFAKCGKVVVVVSEERESTIYIFDIENNSVDEMTLHGRATEIIRLEDGRVIVGFFRFDESIFREIDISNATLERTYSTTFGSSRMFPAEAESSFDILLITGGNLNGYSFETNELTPILNWIEAGFVIDSDANIGVLPNSRVFVYTVSMVSDERYDIDLYILTPALREDVPEVTTLTLGGFFVSDELRRAVVKFNQENDGFQIIIREYWDEVDGDWRAAQLRYRTEIITGGGPDIIVYPEPALSDGGFLVDLYTLIDADNELSREDFFPNALKVLEASDGSLATFSNSFAITTMYGLPDVVGHIGQSSWTTQRMLALLKDNTEMFAPFGQWVDRVDFVRTMLMSSGDELINWSAGEAYLDSEEFIEILEAAAFLPSHDELMDVYQGDYVGDWILLHQKERLLLDIRFWSPLDYQQIVVDDNIYILGVPTFEGGKNIIFPGEGTLGINASSKYKDEAWLFLRHLILHPDAAETVTDEIFKRRRRFPIRIDLYDDLIDLAMTPIPGNVPHGWVKVFDWWYAITQEGAEGQDSFPIYAMTQKEADDLRAIIESAVPQRRRVEDELWNHLVDDLNSFFTGNRTAHDTARIMQNRVQTYLNERS